jgi:hypothetical protein
LLICGFGLWLRTASPSLRGNLFEILPKIAGSIEGLQTEGINKILAVGNKLITQSDRDRFFKSIEGYGSTGAPILVGICSIAHRSLKWARLDYLDKLSETIPPQKTLENADTNKLIPSIAQLSELCFDKGKACWCCGLDLVLTLADTNCSSAYVATRELRKILPRLSANAWRSYLEDFHKLAGAVGIRVVGFATKKLPGFYEKFGVERTRAFVDATAIAAKTYGVTAGQWFYERKTLAARELLIK